MLIKFLKTRIPVQLYNACPLKLLFLLWWMPLLLWNISLSNLKNKHLTRQSLQLCNSLYLKIIICFCFSLLLTSAILQVIKVLSWVYLSMAGEVNGAFCPWRRSQQVNFYLEGKVSGVWLGAECRLSCI